MKKKRKVKNKLAEKLAEQEVLDRLLRAMERGRCTHELEGLLKEIELIELFDPDFKDDAKKHDISLISLGVKWAIAKLKGEDFRVDD